MSHKGIIWALWQHPKKETSGTVLSLLIAWKNAVVLTSKIDVTALAVLQEAAPSLRNCGGGRTPGSLCSSGQGQSNDCSPSSDLKGKKPNKRRARQ